MDKWLKIVFCDANNVHLALGVFRRVGGVGGVDHNGLTKFATDRPKRRFRRIGRSEDFANLEDRINPLIRGRRTFDFQRQCGARASIHWDGCPP